MVILHKTEAMLVSQRHLFEVPRSVCYLNAAYMGPRLTSVSDAGRMALTAGSAPWTTTSRDFFEVPDQLRQYFSEIADARPDDIALIPSVSYGIGIAAANLAPQPGEDILLLAEQFPSNVYPWQILAQRCQANIRTVARPADSNWTRAVLENISERTAIAALPQVHWTDGTALDLQIISDRCRESGTALVLDLTQSLGAVPFSVSAIQPDFMVAAAYKWLLSPYGVSFLYAAPWHQQGMPLEQAWISRAGSENFAGLIDYHDQYRPGARRYDAGEHSNFILLPMARAALAQILAWQPSRIAATLQSFTTEIADRALALDYEVAPASARSPHLLGLGFPGPIPEGLVPALQNANVHVSVRGCKIRVAPHLHNDAQDLARFFAVIEQFAP